MDWRRTPSSSSRATTASTLGSRGFAGKWSHYEESLRVPLIVRDPRLGPADQGGTADAMALNLDIPATMLDLAGIEQPAAYRGRSVRPFLTAAETPEWRTDFFVEHLMELGGSIPKFEGVRGDRIVYARYFEQEPAYEFLHDLERDPAQLENLVADPAYRETLDHLRARTDTLRDAPRRRVRPRPFSRAAGARAVGAAEPRLDHRRRPVVDRLRVHGPSDDRDAESRRPSQRGRRVLPGAMLPTALCRPSLATLATGLYAHTHGITGNDPSVAGAPPGVEYWNDPRYRALNQRVVGRIDDTPSLPDLLADARVRQLPVGQMVGGRLRPWRLHRRDDPRRPGSRRPAR